MSENTPSPGVTPSEKTIPAPVQPSEPPTEKTQEKSPESPSSRKKKLIELVTDSLLVGLLLTAIGGTGYYLKEQYKRFRVPTPMELVMKENEQLCKRHEELRERAFHADEQLHMRRRLAHREIRLGQDSRRIAELEASIAEQRNRILAIQHEIRSTDKEYRSVARSLLPGMPIGNATTTNGKVYRNAVIYRLDGKNIALRTPEGQSRFPVSRLVKDNLPTLARYAFGLENLVDMSDFDTAETLDTPVAEPSPRTSKPEPAPQKDSEPSYEPEGGAPVVDTDANSTSTNAGGDDGTPEATDDGLAPW